MNKGPFAVCVRIALAAALALSALLACIPAQSAQAASGGEVVAVELFEYGTWNDEGQIDDAGESLELFVQLTFDTSDYLSWAQWEDAAGDYTGSYYAYSSDESVATVSTQDPQYGQVVVTAVAEGTAEITVVYTPYGGDDSDKITSSVFTVTVPEQAPEYVVDIAILNSDGTETDDDPIVFYETGAYMQFYVQLTWYNSETGETWTQRTTEDDTELSVVSWESDATDFVYVNPSTGRIAVLSNSTSVSARVSASTSAGKNGTTLSDSVYITYDGQDSRTYVPAESLTITVEYEEMPADYEPVEYEFTIEEVIAACDGLQYEAYTYFRQNGSYSTHFVQGVRLYEVIEMVHTDIDDIVSFRFSSQINDGYEIPISHAMMYETTHYFCTEPEIAYSFSGNQWKQYATATTPLLAVAAYTAQGEDFNDYMNSDGTVDWDEVPLDDAQLFRLEIGCTGPDDTRAQSKSVYNVDTIVIVLEGAPPATDGDDEAGSGEDGADGDDDDVEEAVVDDAGGSGGDDEGEGTSSGAGEQGASAAASAGAQGDEEDADEASGAAESSGSGNEDAQGSKRWQVYQVMSNVESTTEVYPSYEDNPLGPYVAFGALACVVAGGCAAALGFRRRMRTARRT